MTRGRLIALEGGEGVGKSTQATRLSDHLRATGLEVVQTREPGGTAGAEAIRDLLLYQVPADGWTSEAEALLFAAARADHVARLIRPALERGAWVVCDRFLGSSLAYQGAAGRIGADAVERLHAMGSGGLLPDVTLVLTLGDDEAARRAVTRAERVDAIGGRDRAYHALVGQAFARQVAESPTVHAVDASGSPDEVTRRIVACLTGLMNATPQGKSRSSPARSELL